MKVPQMISAELRRLTASRMALIALVALLAVPVIYGGLYLWANQDPYAKLAEVPVALVVDDAGSADGSRNIGDEVADQLMASGTFDWQRVSADEAAHGVADGAYDFSVTFPADFTAALQSSSTDSPRQGQVVLSTNDANSYLATTIGEQAVKTIKAEIVRSVNQEAAITFLDGLADIRGRLGDAATGAGTLTDATGQALAGATQLHDGATQLAAGASSLAAGASQVADGARQVADGNARLAAKADQVGTVVGQAAAAVPTARADILRQLQAAGLDQATIDAVMARLDRLGEDVAAGNDRVRTVVGQIDELSAGASQVADGAARVASGAGDAASGAAALQSGSGTLADGLGRIDDGAATLRDGLAAGRDAIPDTDADTRRQQADTIADPVSLHTGSVAKAGSYGAGLAPFFAALAGWIGIYALFLIVKPVSKRAVTALHSPIRVTLAGWLTPALLGAVQMSVLYVVLAAVLEFRIANPAAMLGVMVLASFTYAAIVLALNVWLGSVGQFLGLVLMVLQLVTAGGTFPWQTLPAPLAALHHVLPMGYVVDALRQAMYGGNASAAWADAGVLAIWLAASFVIAALGVTRMTHGRTLRDLRPSLIG